MKQPKYVYFYQKALQRGCSCGFVPGRGFTLELPGKKTCTYLTAMFDTGEGGGSYQRLTVDCDFEDIKLEVIVAATDLTHAVIAGREVALGQYFALPEVPAEEKTENLMALSHIRVTNCRDLLLHSLKGRYIWIYVAVYPGGEHPRGCLRGLQLEFPKNSFTDYFPEIYQGNEFFERFIGIFQSMYMDAEREVDELPALLDYESAPPENVEQLAAWVGVDNTRGLFSTEQLRYLVGHIDLFQGAKGTKVALDRILRLVTGAPPRVVEYFQWDRPALSAENRALYQTLYGETGSHFCVILEQSGIQGNLIPPAELERLIESYTVIGARFKLVLLEKCDHTDTHCYLDINSVLSVPETARADGITLGSHITVG